MPHRARVATLPGARTCPDGRDRWRGRSVPDDVRGIRHARVVRARTVVVLTGLPGTGKSTLADLLARVSGAPAFAGDWLLGALAPHGILDHAEWSTLLAAYRDLLASLVTRQLLLGQSAVVDCVLDNVTVTAWRRDIGEHGGRLVVAECVCSDDAVHRRRVERRRRGIPGWHEIGWAHVERMRREFRPVTDKQLTLDAINPIDHNLRLLTALIAD
jgi:predicted kinase